MNKVLTIIIMTASFSLLTACGGGSSDSAFDPEIGGDPDPGTPVAGVSPIVPLTTSGSNTSSFDSSTRTLTEYFDSGFSGDIEARTVLETIGGVSSNYQETILAAGIPSMNVNDVQRTQAVYFLCDNDDEIRGTISTDFSSGEEVISGTINGVSLNCLSKYDSVLPTSIAGEGSIAELIYGYGDENNSFTTLRSSNCADDETLGIPDPAVTFCNGIVLTNVVVTDEFDFQHKFAHKIQYDYSN